MTSTTIRRITVDLPPGEHEIRVRAWDSSAATQPEDEAALWNPKGYVNNARPRIRVRAAPAGSRSIEGGPLAPDTTPLRHLAKGTCPGARGRPARDR